MTRKLSLGIDLGTSNSCLSLCAVDGGPAQTVPVTQVLAPAVIGEKPLLPSVLYLPAPGEYADGSFILPWNDADARGSIVGSFARERGATVPDRVVSSAKSWLCNPDVDRRAPILPWQSDLGDAKISPFEATLNRQLGCVSSNRRRWRASTSVSTTDVATFLSGVTAPGAQ